MAALVYEVVWIRPLSLVFGNTTYAISTIIAAFIFGLAIGSWAAGKYSDKIKNPFRYFAFAQIGIGIYGIILLPIFGALPEMYLDVYNATYPNQYFFTFLQIIFSMALILVPTSLMGATLPLMLKTYSQNFSSIGKDVGKLDASNSFGAMVGTLAAGFLMIPLLGIQNSIVLAASINIGMGISILIIKRFFNYRNITILGITIILLFLFIPSYDIRTLNVGVFFSNQLDPTKIDEYYGDENILFYKESLYSTILVIEDQGVTRLTINGRTQCSTYPEAINALGNLGHTPFELFEYNYGKPNNALNIGLGCGITSKELSTHLNTTTVEIDTAVVEANQFFFENIDHNIIIDDARNWLTRNNESFEIITTEPSDPFINRSVMFTKEFFSLLNSRLAENGVLAQWVPTYEMSADDFFIFYNTFHAVFPYVYAYEMEQGDGRQIIFIGSKKPMQIPDNDRYLFSHNDIIQKETILNTDDRPVIEFSVAQQIYKSTIENREITPIT